MIEVFNFIYKQTNKVNMSRLSVQVLIIAPNEHQLNQNGLLKFQAGLLEKFLYGLHQLPAALGVIVTKLHVDTVSLHFLFSLYIYIYICNIMYVLQRTSVYL